MPVSTPQAVQDCFGLISYALTESQQGRFDRANRALALALINARGMPAEFLTDFRAAHIYGILAIQSRQKRENIPPDKRARAAELLHQSSVCDSDSPYQELMFRLLVEMGEHRRAIPFGERAMALVETGKSHSIGDWLSKIGQCYARLGLRDHAAIAYRASVRIFRDEPADPRLPVALLALGNAVRKSSPPEAEALYLEAAALWESKGHLESATAAWMNLGIMYSDQRRFEEAIEYYERVRRVRESSAGTPRARIGVLYNNLANCYRKMDRFADAYHAVDRATEILSEPGVIAPHDPNWLASCLGTRGLILRDEGRDAESIEWFRRARAAFEEHPTPNLENVIEELAHEENALARLNRIDEVRVVQERTRSVRAAAAETPLPSHDGDPPIPRFEGALFVELDRGIRDPRYTEIVELGSRLYEILKEQCLGDWYSLIRIPESSTLIYYGADAEAMYRAIEAALRSDSRCAGAQVTIRQSGQQREVIVEGRSVN
jgi:tetratricopeptide (TPR) repeat protein